MSHTKVFGSIRIHFNSDFSGEVTIQNDHTDQQITVPSGDAIELAQWIASYNEPA